MIKIQRIENNALVCLAAGLIFLMPLSIEETENPERFKAGSVFHNNNNDWNKTFGGEEMDRGYSVQQTHDEGYIIAGDTESFGSGKLDFWLIKIDANGNEVWNKTFGGEHSERCFACRQTSDKGYILVGWKSYGTEDKLADVWLIKTDIYGNEQWNRTYGDQNWNSGYCVQQTVDGGYIIVGETCTSGYELGDIWLIKSDSSGNMEWSRTFGGDKDDYGASAQQTMDGGFIIAGNTDLGAILIKTNENGVEEWSKIYEGSASSVQQIYDGGYVITGSISEKRWQWQYSNSDIWIVKTDEEGKELWKKTFGTNHYDRGTCAQQTDDGGFIIVGETVAVRASFDYNGFNMYDIWLIKTDSVGDVEWMKKLGGNDYEFAHEVHPTLDGGYIIIGETASYGKGGYDIWLIKTAEPALKLELRGGFGIFIVLNNTGDDDLFDIEWSMYIDGMIYFGKYTQGTIASLPAGGEVVVGSGGFVFGFGLITIIVTLDDTAMMLRCFLLGPLMLPV